MTKRKLIGGALIALALTLFCGRNSVSAAPAGCYTGGGYYSINKITGADAYKKFADIGAGPTEQLDGGVNWACGEFNPYGRALLFFTDKNGYHTKASSGSADNVGHKGGSNEPYVNFHVNIDINAFVDDQQTIGVMGLLSGDPKKGGDGKKMYRNAVDVAFCMEAKDCVAKDITNEIQDYNTGKMSDGEFKAVAEAYHRRKPKTDTEFFDVSGISKTNSCPSTKKNIGCTSTYVIPRGGLFLANHGQWSFPEASQVKQIKIWPRKIYNYAKSHPGQIVTETKDYVQIKVHNFRCFQQSGNKCGANPMILTLRKQPLKTEINFDGSSTAEVIKNDENTGEYEIRFTHTVKRTGGSENHLVENRIIVEEENSTKVDNPNIKTDEIWKSNTTGEEKNFQHTISGKIGAGEEIKICQTMGYVKHVDGDTKTRAKTTPACVVLQRENGTCSGLGVEFSNKMGINVGSIGVRNLSLSTGWVDTELDTEKGILGEPIYSNVRPHKHIWARPGDNIQFRYRMCAGAELANRTWGEKNTKLILDGINVAIATMGGGAIPPEVSEMVAGKANIKIPTKFVAQGLKQDHVYAGEEWGRNHFFTSGGVTLDETYNVASPYAFGIGVDYWNNLIPGSFMNNETSPMKNSVSPGVDQGLLYACPGNTGRPPMIGAYQVGGATGLLDKALCIRPDIFNTRNDVGSTISQRLLWTPLRFAAGAPLITLNWGDIIRGQTNVYSSAHVHVPYNYRVSVSPGNLIETKRHLTAGQKINSGFIVNVSGRKNTTVAPDAYRTRTKKGKYRVFGWLSPSANSVDDTIGYLANREAAEAQTYKNEHAGVLPDGHKGYLIEEDPASFTPDGLMFSSSDNQAWDGSFQPISGLVGGVDVNVPLDAKVGEKFCVAAAVYPADSHDRPFAEDVAGTIEEQKAAFTEGTGRYWRTSEPSCFTISKTNSIAVGGGTMLVQNGIRTSSTSRDVKREKENLLVTKRTKNTNASWAEYAIKSAAINSEGDFSFFDRAVVIGMGSGASRVGHEFSVSPLNKACRFSPLTISNSICGIGLVGDYQEPDQRNVGAANAAELKALYGNETTTDDGSPIRKANGARELAFNGNCVLGASGHFEREGVDSALHDDDYNCMDNGVRMHRVDPGNSLAVNSLVADDKNDATICLPKGSPNSSNLSVVRSDGTILIKANIRRGTPDATGKCDFDPSNQVYRQTSEIPQMVIIADRVVVHESVEHIDAMIIARSFVSCANDIGLSRGDIDVGTCNKQLVVNGPVFANKFNLHRTYGGGSSDYSNSGSELVTSGNTSQMIVSPSEIFDVGAENYLWASSQNKDQRNASSSYVRELAPRY